MFLNYIIKVNVSQKIINSYNILGLIGQHLIMNLALIPLDEIQNTNKTDNPPLHQFDLYTLIFKITTNS